MRIYRLEPAALPGDPNWDRAPSQGTVLVRAASPADARIAAAEAEDDFLGTDGKPGDGTTTRFASAFRDEKLYSISEAVGSPYPDDGERGIVEGHVDPEVIRRARAD